MTSPSSPSPTWRHRLRPVALGLLAGTALGLAACKPPPPDPPIVRPELRTCDASMCLLAWEVVDSDGDGVADADELVAGTDPHDPRSRPGMAELVKLVTGRGLPTFEFGRAALQVVPAEIQARREEARTVPVSPAIPATPERATGLAALGIDLGQLSAMGIDPNRDGFTLGLGKPEEAETGERPPTVPTRFDISLISADDEALGNRPQDVESPIPLEMDHGEVVQHVDYGDWSSTTWADGAQTICSNGGGCRTDPAGADEYYTNPDADPGVFEPTEADKARIARVRGGVIRTVEGWQSPGGGEPPENSTPTIALIDPEHGPGLGISGVTVVTDAPRLTTAQPEFHPGLPSPLVPAVPDGCTVGCPR